MKHLFTESDNRTWCLARVICGGGFVNVIVDTNLALIAHKQAFDVQAFCAGFAVLIGAVTTALAAKGFAENQRNSSGQ